MTPPPTVSVIVPVRDRRDMLRDLLDGLAKQTHSDFEVIVIDDGSTDGSDALARETVIADRPVRVFGAGGKGALAARRLGVERSKGRVLAFTDSDCVPGPEWLSAAAAAFADGAEMVNGFTRPMRPLRPMERSMASGTEGLYPTCNIFFTRDLYDRLGGFDADAASRWRFRVTNRAKGLGFGEDTLIGWEAVRAGADTRYVAEAIVEHQVFPPDVRDFTSRLAQVAAFPAMTREIPELRGTLMRDRIFLGNYDRLPVYAALAAILLRRKGLLAAVLAWWIGRHVNVYMKSPHPALEQLPWLPVDMATDVAMAGALVAGSVSARSLVL